MAGPKDMYVRSYVLTSDIARDLNLLIPPIVPLIAYRDPCCPYLATFHLLSIQRTMELLDLSSLN